MRVIVALGGNALLRRGEPLTAANQRANVRVAAEALAPIAQKHELIISHGNGPQVGLLALQSAVFKPEEAYPLDILGAESEGMIGYLIEQELRNWLQDQCRVATLLTQIEVDSSDPAFRHPTKPIGPVYSESEAGKLARRRHWTMAPNGNGYRRVVPSPRPRHILELSVIELLVDQGVIVICAGGGGIPVVKREDGSFFGVEAVIDKDSASALLAKELDADAFLMLTDVDAVYQDWQTPNARAIRHATPKIFCDMTFAEGSMDPKVKAACEFVEKTGGLAGIGRLQDAHAILKGKAGTIISQDVAEMTWWEKNTEA